MTQQATDGKLPPAGFDLESSLSWYIFLFIFIFRIHDLYEIAWCSVIWVSLLGPIVTLRGVFGFRVRQHLKGVNT